MALTARAINFNCAFYAPTHPASHSPSYSPLVLFAFLFHYAKEKRWRCLFCTFHWAEAATPRLTPLMENYNFFLLIFWHAYFSFFFIFFPTSCSCFLLRCASCGLPGNGNETTDTDTDEDKKKHADFGRLNLSDLRARLRARGLSVTGRKQTLIERLATTATTTSATEATTSYNLSPSRPQEQQRQQQQQQQLVNYTGSYTATNSAAGNNESPRNGR